MADYSVLCENQQIEIGKAGENLARSCTIDYSAWLKEYGEGDLRIRAIRSGDAEPYPVTNVTTENGVATWIFTDADTAIKGYGEIQILYYVEDVLVKSRVWRTYTHRSLSTSSEEVPDPYQDWLSEVERIGSQIEEDAESASDSATRAAGSASEAAESALSASRSASAALGSAGAASSSADSAASSATAASRSATEASNYEYNSEQYMNEAKSAKFGAESARTGAENAKAAAQASATAAAQSAEQAEETAESIEASADLIQKLLANQIHDTATGTIASFPDGADMPFVSLVADIDPIQDTSGGAPSPSHICPISGWDSVDVSVAGKNLLNPILSDWSNVGTYLHINNVVPEGVSANMTFVDKDTSVNLSGINMGWVYENVDNSRADHYKWCINNGAKIANTTNESNNLDSDRRICQNIFIYPKTEEAFSKLFARYDIQVEFGTSATSYEPYVEPTTITTTLPQTVYGGTLDVVSGVLTVTHKEVTFNTSSGWSVAQSNSHYRAYKYMNDIKSLAGSQAITEAISDKFERSTWNAVFTGKPVFGQTGTAIGFGVDDFGITTEAELGTWINNNPLQVVYPLATPTTIQLTPTQIDSLMGRNNVWADSGDVTVEYIADTKLYIQKVMGAIG